MLRQHINLLEFINNVKIEKYNININVFLAINIIINIAMLIICAMHISNFFHLDKILGKTTDQLASRQKELILIKNRFPAAFFAHKETAAQNEIMSEIASSKALLRELGHPILFSSILLSLSKNIPDQVWLTKIVIDDEGNNIMLNGSSYSVSQLEQFVNNLSLDDKLSNYLLNINKVSNRNEKNKNPIIDFEIIISEKNKNDSNK